MITSGPETLSQSLFTQHFTTLKEPRRTTKGNFQYPLNEILFLTISSIISGWFEEWDDITFFGENNLHWCLDVIMKEDGQLNYIGNAAQNMNMMKKMALGMLANEKSTNSSKARKMKKALLEEDYRELLLKV